MKTLMIKFIAISILSTQTLGGIIDRGKIAIAQPNANQIGVKARYAQKLSPV
jgi:hypothetical protein